ncbi:MAG TPA: FliA/WhiG family RNA polymerase sigma factor [Bacteroidota bacterium]|nr:FliA/WhiG family RNA polymerase sigma factor [Bacteroidota bacterium]
MKSAPERDGAGKEQEAKSKKDVVVRYAPLVHFVVSRFGLQGRGRSLGLEHNDLVQAGMIGLLDAVERYSPALGVKFETYAVSRIRGTILDELRRLDWVPRAVYAQHRAYRDAQDQVIRETGREAVGAEIAAKLSMTEEEYRRFIIESGETMNKDAGWEGERRSGTEVETIAAESPTPDEQLSQKQIKQFLMDAINGLPPRQRAIIALYYYEGLKFGEIATVLRISESRVSQVHSAILSKLRGELAALEEDL